MEGALPHLPASRARQCVGPPACRMLCMRCRTFARSARCCRGSGCALRNAGAREHAPVQEHAITLSWQCGVGWCVVLDVAAHQATSDGVAPSGRSGCAAAANEANKACCAGPEGTPYSGGCFLFDIYFPSQYPTLPPNVILRTTGGPRPAVCSPCVRSARSPAAALRPLRASRDVCCAWQSAGAGPGGSHRHTQGPCLQGPSSDRASRRSLPLLRLGRPPLKQHPESLRSASRVGAVEVQGHLPAVRLLAGAWEGFRGRTGAARAGGGSVRFNPNLYNCGKVCLSLLGTWGGSRGEGWDAHSSSALQARSLRPQG